MSYSARIAPPHAQAARSGYPGSTSHACLCTLPFTFERLVEDGGEEGVEFLYARPEQMEEITIVEDRRADDVLESLIGAERAIGDPEMPNWRS